ncbi:hypothetical protein [Flavobacterium sp. MK4S-17]|uniref:hypothetical protein n=1 Tax=Flavobacterium sp. MK4S-17 TaxID=2543737 RepID=UPI001359144C|nr:hypothetical protein [Flavobacterium sp. MK4S-17]
MKNVVTVLFALLLLSGCASTALKKQGDKIFFEYEALTRGAYKKVIVKHDTIITINEKALDKERVIDKFVNKKPKKRNWNKILAELEKVNLNKLSTLKPPSTRSHHDGALIANLKVIKQDTTYQSSSFDHGNPPMEIKGLVNRIIEVSDLEK